MKGHQHERLHLFLFWILCLDSHRCLYWATHKFLALVAFWGGSGSKVHSCQPHNVVHLTENRMRSMTSTLHFRGSMVPVHPKNVLDNWGSTTKPPNLRPHLCHFSPLKPPVTGASQTLIALLSLHRLQRFETRRTTRRQSSSAGGPETWSMPKRKCLFLCRIHYDVVWLVPNLVMLYYYIFVLWSMDQIWGHFIGFSFEWDLLG